MPFDAEGFDLVILSEAPKPPTKRELRYERVGKLIALLERIEGIEGQHFNMSRWAFRWYTRTPERTEKNFCHTSGCIAGWVAMGLCDVPYKRAETQSSRVAMEYLMLNEQQACTMFYAGSVDREKAIKMLKRFQRTGRVSWKGIV